MKLELFLTKLVILPSFGFLSNVTMLNMTVETTRIIHNTNVNPLGMMRQLLVPLRGKEKAKGFISKTLRILSLVGLISITRH